MGWFDWKTCNSFWQWTVDLLPVGAIALLPLIGTISGILGPIGAIVGLFEKKAVLITFGTTLESNFSQGRMLALGQDQNLYRSWV